MKKILILTGGLLCASLLIGANNLEEESNLIEVPKVVIVSNSEDKIEYNEPNEDIKYPRTRVNMRYGPGEDSEIFRVLDINEGVVIADEENGWSRCVFEEESFYIKSEYLSDDPVEQKYTDEEIILLAHLIYAEAGSDWIDNETLYYVGSVVLNRVESDEFPDSISGVIFQDGQYQCVDNGSINNEPTTRCYRIAEELLNYGSVLPSNVLFQAEFYQGSGVYDEKDGLKFCYI